MNKNISEWINILNNFCGKRDIPALTSYELNKKYGFSQADVMVLFGGTILCGGDVLAHAIQNKVAKKYIIVGGIGHTTSLLREKVKELFPEINTKNFETLSEAEIFSNYLKYKYNLKPDLLECNSTNCGNNITYMLDLLNKHKIPFKNIIISQDATMQLRMDATLRKYVSNEIEIINYATYSVKVSEKDGNLTYDKNIPGMWDINHFITLLMGEIPRLTDDKNGYGPKGKNYLAHIDIPDNVQNAFSELKKIYANSVRQANPLYSG